MKASDLREKSVADLVELRKALTSEIFQNRLKNFTNRLDDTSAMRKGRRDLARVFTVLGQLEAGAASSGSAAKTAAQLEPKGETAQLAQLEPKAKAAKKAKAEAAPAAPAKKATKKKSESSSR